MLYMAENNTAPWQNMCDLKQGYFTSLKLDTLHNLANITTTPFNELRHSDSTNIEVHINNYIVLSLIHIFITWSQIYYNIWEILRPSNGQYNKILN